MLLFEICDIDQCTAQTCTGLADGDLAEIDLILCELGAVLTQLFQTAALLLFTGFALLIQPACDNGGDTLDRCSLLALGLLGRGSRTLGTLDLFTGVEILIVPVFEDLMEVFPGQLTCAQDGTIISHADHLVIHAHVLPCLDILGLGLGRSAVAHAEDGHDAAALRSLLVHFVGHIGSGSIGQYTSVVPLIGAAFQLTGAEAALGLAVVDHQQNNIGRHIELVVDAVEDLNFTLADSTTQRLLQIVADAAEGGVGALGIQQFGRTVAHLAQFGHGTGLFADLIKNEQTLGTVKTAIVKTGVQSCFGHFASSACGGGIAVEQGAVAVIDGTQRTHGLFGLHDNDQLFVHGKAPFFCDIFLSLLYHPMPTNANRQKYYGFLLDTVI